MNTPWKHPLLYTCILLLCSACDKRTPEEKGRDYAEEKLGFVEGATGELKKRGKDIGSNLGRGVGDLVKGTGSAVKDVAHPPVKVIVAQQIQSEGLSIGQANEGSDTADSREIIVHVQAKKPFRGKLMLEGKGEGNVRVRPLAAEEIDLPSDGNAILHFKFDPSVRLSKVTEFSLLPGESRELALDESVQKAGISASQLLEKKNEEGYEVSVYAVFEKSFRQKLSLRAYDENDTEVGRSRESDKLKQTADSAQYVAFQFDERVPFPRVKKYRIFAKP